MMGQLIVVNFHSFNEPIRWKKLLVWQSSSDETTPFCLLWALWTAAEIQSKDLAKNRLHKIRKIDSGHNKSLGIISVNKNLRISPSPQRAADFLAKNSSDVVQLSQTSKLTRRGVRYFRRIWIRPKGKVRRCAAVALVRPWMKHPAAEWIDFSHTHTHTHTHTRGRIVLNGSGNEWKRPMNGGLQGGRGGGGMRKWMGKKRSPETTLAAKLPTVSEFVGCFQGEICMNHGQFVRRSFVD